MKIYTAFLSVVHEVELAEANAGELREFLSLDSLLLHPDVDSQSQARSSLLRQPALKLQLLVLQVFLLLGQGLQQLELLHPDLLGDVTHLKKVQ